MIRLKGIKVPQLQKLYKILEFIFDSHYVREKHIDHLYKNSILLGSPPFSPHLQICTILFANLTGKQYDAKLLHIFSKKLTGSTKGGKDLCSR